jgi:hypothetical protein
MIAFYIKDALIYENLYDYDLYFVTSSSSCCFTPNHFPVDKIIMELVEHRVI